MPYTSRILVEHELIVSHGRALIKPAEMFEAIAALKELPDYRPNLDRIIIIDDNARVSEIDMNALIAFKDKLHNETPPSPSDPPETPTVFLAAIICNNRQHTGITELYVALLKTDPKVDATFKHFPTINLALAWLGKPDAAAEVA